MSVQIPPHHGWTSAGKAGRPKPLFRKLGVNKTFHIYHCPAICDLAIQPKPVCNVMTGQDIAVLCLITNVVIHLFLMNISTILLV